MLNYGIESGKLLKQCFPEAYEEVKAITDTIGYPKSEDLFVLLKSTPERYDFINKISQLVEELHL